MDAWLHGDGFYISSSKKIRGVLDSKGNYVFHCEWFLIHKGKKERGLFPVGFHLLRNKKLLDKCQRKFPYIMN